MNRQPVYFGPEEAHHLLPQQSLATSAGKKSDRAAEDAKPSQPHVLNLADGSAIKPSKAAG